ncbi:MAG: caspase family protein [Bacteroidia bacterium]|nr:caspase family protein [Bacteroidia bacterium]
MNRCAVVIGVNKTGDMPVLQAAVSGAQQFAAWATAQGINVSLLTDENESVSLGDIKNAIRHYVRQRTFNQLIVYFSGHGILRGPDYELWLLSGAPDDPDDAVNVPGSIWLARNVGIPHVVVISDACRSLPNTSRLSQIQGGVIFPNESPKAPRPAVDVFYATLPGDPAMEVSAVDATENYRGIFTDCLLKGLLGHVPDVIVNIAPPLVNEEKWVVPSWELKPYLEQEVPDAAASVHIRLQQDPDIRVESHPPNYLAEFARPSSATSPRTARTDQPDQVRFGDVVRSLKETQFFQGRIHDTSLSHHARAFAEQSGMAGAIHRLMDAKGRESFETRTGFSVLGTAVERAVVTDSGCDVFQENGAFQIRVHSDEDGIRSRSTLMQITGGLVIPLAVLPGYIGTVVVEEGRVVTVNYLPSRNTEHYSEYEHFAHEVEQRRAFVSVAARNGAFRFESTVEAAAGADYLRMLKAIDPTLGLHSAYAYAQAGDFQGIKSVFEYMSRESVPVLFDVAMLCAKLDAPAINSERLSKIAPFCPMLTQGWAFVDVSEVWLPAVVRRAREHLRPGLWTTFGEKGASILWSHIEEGGVL